MNIHPRTPEPLACGQEGTPPFPGAMPYLCSLPQGHPGAHVARADRDRTVDTWPRREGDDDDRPLPAVAAPG